MNRIAIGSALVFAFVTSIASAQEDRLHTDWAYLARYRDANAAIQQAAAKGDTDTAASLATTEGNRAFNGFNLAVEALC